ncbi:MAG: type I-C CRISPR-associated protein Cas8c/Csd1 [Candidatus Omnitrophica bacterium]|nr:type I-C CRISPR-associated protein Cas8c/Csd1 [Candidatus Omnitrophota bacterium]
MILQALYNYYQRKAADPESGIAPEGWEWKTIPFLVVIANNGKYLRLNDTREIEGKKKIPKAYLVPRGIGRAGKDACETAQLFWDHYGYVLGLPKNDTDKDKKMAEKQLASFIRKIEGLPNEVKKISAVDAVLKFYKHKEYNNISIRDVQECLKIAGCNMTFYVEGCDCLVTEEPSVRKYVNSLIEDKANIDRNIEESDKSAYEAVCLITGEKGLIQRKHARTSINKDTKSFVAIQKSSGYDSYGKQQAFNCPVGVSAEFAYTTALNALLKKKENRIQIADTTIIFWSQKKDKTFDLESNFAWFFKSEKDNPDRNIQAVKGLYEALYSSKMPLDENNRFYVLGLAPNAARIAVRFWKTGTIREFAEKIRQHFEDFAIVHGPKDPEHLSLYQILTSTVLNYKMDNVPPNLAGAVIVSILDGFPYPQTLLHQCVRRIRAEQQVTRARAAILKACINRFNRFYNKSEKEVLMSLDKSNTNAAYRLGRLFAVLEKIQEEAAPGINATIRERFYGAASSTPVTVFPRLLKLKNHHLAKLNPGRKINFEKEIGEICDELKDTFPGHLTLDAQARFAVGYYHQRQDFFKKKGEKNSNINEAIEEDL